MEVKNLETTTEQICLQSLRDLIQSKSSNLNAILAS